MFGRLSKARRHAHQTDERRSPVPDRAAPSLARDVVVALIDPGSGKLWDNVRPLVAAALLVELAHEGRLEVSGTGKKVRVTVRDPAPSGDEELDDALLTVGSGAFGQKVVTLVGFLPDESEILRRLVAAGVVVEEPRRVLGVVPLRRYRTTPSAGREELVARVRSALLGESVPDERTALLVSVLDLATPLTRFVPRSEVGEADRRAREIRGRVGDAERAVMEAVQESMSRSDGSTSGV